MKKFVVFGNPIKQSLSPFIHQNFAQQANIDISYDKRLSEVDIFESDLRQFFEEQDVVGCNVTAPFKQQAFKFAQLPHPSAKYAQAANTLHRVNGQIECHNTDGTGLINDLLRINGRLSSSRVLLLGAGGAARGVIQSLLDQGINSLTIANRTQARAQALVDLFGDIRLTASTLSALHESFDIVINSTSASLTGDALDLGKLRFNETKLTYDMSYKATQTPFLNHAEQLGSQQCADGLGMLIGQAAASFHIWTGFNPDIEPLIESLRRDMLA